MTTPTPAQATRYGTVQHNGKTYTLTADADYTNRLLPAPYVNYNDVAEGEAYDFEMTAPALDTTGQQVTVYWLFEGVKGEDDPELDSYDYDTPSRVEVL